MHEWMVFIDFDGTITSEETLSGAVRHLSPPGLDAFYQSLRTRTATMSAALKTLFSEIPSQEFPRIMEYLKSIPVRAGFDKFLTLMEQKQIPIVVVSGGLTPMLDFVLAPYSAQLHAQYSVALALDGPCMRLHSQYDDGVELLKKTDILALYEYQKCICIGDSITDRSMALCADVVFARDGLAAWLAREGRKYINYHDFHDIIYEMQFFL